MRSFPFASVAAGRCLRSAFRLATQTTISRFFVWYALLPLGIFSLAQTAQPPHRVPPSRPIQVLRYFDPATNVHAFTSDDNGTRLPESFQRESTVDGTPDSPFFYLATMQFPGTVPLYRFRAADGSQRFVRTEGERNALRSQGMEELAKPVFVYSTPVEGASELVCLKNPENGDLLYTTSQAEKSYLLGLGWTKKASLGYTQSSSSSGTGILWPTTVKLEDADMALLAMPARDGSKLVFASTNKKIAGLAVGSVLYAPVKINRGANGDVFVRPGFMRRVTSISSNGSGLVIETSQAKYKDLFRDLHLFLDNRPAAFARHDAGTVAAASMVSQAPVTGAKRKSFDGHTDYREPEYLSHADQSVSPDDASASLSFNEDLNYTVGDDGLNVITVSGGLGAELTGEINVSEGCSDSINLLFGSICDQWTLSGTVLFTPSASASATATVNVGGNFSIEKKVFEESETFEVEGVPVTVTFDIKVGASLSDQATATFSATALARGTGGFSADLVIPEVWDSGGSVIGCPNPCPDGFSCGASDQGYSGSGPTCSVTANASSNINLNPGTVDAKVWVTPEISAGPGLDDLSASVSFALQNALEFDISSTEVTGTYELTPSVGYDVGLCLSGYNIGFSGSDDLTELDVPIFSGGMPAATTQNPSSVTVNSAMLSGMVTPTDLNTTAWFIYATNPSLTGAATTMVQTCAGIACNLTFPLSGLQSGQTYYYELVAKNILGTTMGGLMSFYVPMAQTITFPNPGTQTYGVAPIALTATASSGLPVSYAVTSGPAMLIGNSVNIEGTGPVTITATQPGNTQFWYAPPVSITFMVNPEPGNFGSVQIGKTSPPLQVTLTFPNNSSVGGIGALTLGATGKDFKGTETGSTSSSVTANVTFSPQAPGPRSGAVVVYDTSTPANVLAIVYLNGVGLGPQAVFSASIAPTTLGTGFNRPQGVAVDGSGNVFVADTNNGLLKEILAAGGYTTINNVGGPYSSDSIIWQGAAIDGGGNLYSVTGASNVTEILAPGFTAANQYTSTYFGADAVAVDSHGNLFVSDFDDSKVYELTMASGYNTANPLGSGFTNPQGVAVDANGNVFVADTGNNEVKEILAAGGYTTVNTLGSGFSSPHGVAVDAAGNVFVGDTGNNAVKEILAASGYSTVLTLGSGFSGPEGVAVDAAGNVYVADTGNSAVKKLALGVAPTITFASTAVNLVSKDSPQTVTIMNDGNSPLTFAANPIVPFGFSLGGSSTCQVGSEGSLAPGASCSFAMEFAPTEPGSITGSLVLTDNSRNAAAPRYTTQSIKLTGNGLLSAVVTASVTAANKTYDGTTTAMATGCSLTGVLPSDVGYVGCSVTSATFAAPGIGNGITVTAKVTLTGAAAGHYVLSSATAPAVANIAPAILTVTAMNHMIPISGAVPGLTYTYSGFVKGQNTSVVTTAPKCSTTATSKSVQGNYPIACSGGVAPNYGFQYVNGTLTVSLAAQFVATEYSLGSGLSSPGGVAVDATGNVYVADTGNNAVKEIMVGNGYSTVTLASGFSSPSGIAVDKSGNLYVADTGNHVVKQLLAAGGFTTVNALGSGFSSPTGVAVDGNGNVFVADSGNNAVKEILAAGGYTTVKMLGSGFSNPTGVALDGSGDVFVADQGNSAIKEIMPAGGYATVNTLGSGFNGPFGVALDANWNVYVTDSGNSMVKQMLAPTYKSVVTLGGDFSQGKGLALDASGNVYVVSGGSNSVQVIAYAPCFPAIAVGSSSLKYSYYFTFLLGGSIGAPSVLTQGATGMDFADAGTGSCTTNGTSHVYKAGDICTVDVIFTPTHPGPRLGSVRLTNASGTLVASALVSGTGTAPQVVFTSNTAPRTVGSGLLTPNAVAVDGNGNVFIADTGNNAVKEILASGGYATVKTLASGFSSPSGVAVDGGGNVYVADTGNKVVKQILAVGGYTKVNTVGGSFLKPTGVAVDGAGNVFVADAGNSTVYEILWGGLLTTLSNSFNGPAGLAADANGDVFVADTGNNAVKEILAAGGYTTVNTLGSGFLSPTGVALDAGGNVYVADTGNNAVKQIVAAGGYTTVNILVTKLSGPTGVVLDGGGDVFVTLSGAHSANELPFSNAPTFSYGSTAVGKTGAARTLTIENNGNATLLPVFIGTTMPTVSEGFAITGGSCLSMIAKGSPWLQPGASCTLSIVFGPQSGQSGTVSGTLTFTDNHLNLNAATQSIALSGIVATPAIVLPKSAAVLQTK